MHENEFLYFFIKKLEEAGFPKNSIASEYALKIGTMRGDIDIAIIEPVTNSILSIFEIKMQRDNRPKKQLLDMAQNQLLKYINLLHNPNILAYVVIANENCQFEIFPFEVDESGSRVLSPATSLENITPYSVLSNKSRANAIKETSSEIKRTTDWFKIACWICAAISIALAILDNLKYITISSTQLALFGVATALVIMPFSKKLKILGVEFERLVAEKKDTKPD